MRVPVRTFWSVLLIAPAPLFAADTIDFDRQIRPILAENCFHCHGPGEEGRQADLRLDILQGATRQQNGRAAIVPGKSAESELVRRILSTDPDELMPPPTSNRKLSAAERELLVKWIDAGAPWSEHWAFQKPVKPTVPRVSGPALAARNPIDAFIFQRLEREGLSPAPEADRHRLLRRVTLELTGVPPTLEEYAAFLNDLSPDAYERVVDRLLTSPRYGERMVWEWLDAARYADTNGYQGDPTRAMWYWRDWAIDALNRNQPFDQFTIEQLAGDLLPNPTREQLIATGFHRNHMINGEGGRIAEESRVDYVQDRVETTGTVWLGLTFNCCRCHDHKFDPIKQREYYQLAAYFNSIEESGANDAGGYANPVMSLANDAQQQRLSELRQAESAADKSRADIEQRVRGEQVAWESAILADRSSTEPLSVQWTTLVPKSLTSRQSTQLVSDAEGTIVARGPNPDRETFSMLFPPPAGTVTAIRLQALPDDELVNHGPGRADNGNFVLSEMIVEVYGRAMDLEVIRADVEQAGWPARNVTDGKDDTGWAILPAFGQPHELIVMPKAPLKVPAEEVLTIRLAFESPHQQHVLGRFRLQVTSDRGELIRGMPQDVLTALSKAQADRSESDQQLITKHYLDTHVEVLAAREAAGKAKSAREGFERSLPRTMVMRERKDPRETFILIRGAYDKFGDKVSHGTPAMLPPLPHDNISNRLALAQWLMSPDHPLTARVTVNRMWQQFFGTGLVKSVDDFGSQGEKPSHPELLDWLACEFVECGWDVKHLQRLIVTSATYRQSSKVSQELVERDPENRLLARGPRSRWPSWMIRDQALALSGLLSERVGGPPVKGYQPPGIWEEATFGKIGYQQDHGAALHRRSLYQFWRRIVGPTVFFDVASRQNCTVKLARTNTPLQALVTLNDVTYVEAARGLSERLLTTSDLNDADRLALAYRLCLGREPNPGERDRLLARLSALRQRYSSDPAAAKALLAVGESPARSDLPPAEMAAWTVIGSVLLNLDEVLSKE